jgi:hypothetical protein
MTEYTLRKNQFTKNFDMIKNSNAKNNTKYKLGLNEFADWSPEEY